MSAERHQRLLEVFLQVCDLPSDRRGARLSEICDEAELQREVLVLLEHHDQPIGAFGDKMSHGEGAQLLAKALDVAGELDDGEHRKNPSFIGRYRVIRRIGEGGMGIVYEAEQEEPRRRVALKVIRPGVMSHRMLTRFRHEAQILGKLRHPGIAQIYDAGMADASEGAHPFFAMELIAGLPLLTFATERGLGTRQRLGLILKVCDALQHAHVHGVIHRDLKPANILIEDQIETPASGTTLQRSREESPGQPKILDFGVARVTDTDVLTVTMQTDVGQLVGTVPYMSPEQIAGDPAELDTRSDIYAVGVIMFELLTGRLPYELRGKMIPEIARIIRDEEPSRLSSAEKSLRGDVETIVAKALEKDKARRYQSAADLASDIRRYLNDEPVLARPASAIYQLRKFAKRNRVLVAGVVTAFALLVAGVIATSWQAYRAREAETQSRHEQRKTAAINEFLIEDVLKGVQRSPDRYNTKLVDVLKAAIPKIDERFADMPIVRGQVSVPLSDTLRILGRFEESRDLARNALGLLRAGLGPDHPETLIAQKQLCNSLLSTNEHSEAEILLRDLIERCRRTLGESASHTEQGLSMLGNALQAQSKFAEAEPLLRNLADTQRATPNRDEELAGTLNSLVASLFAQGKNQEALPICREQLELARRKYGDEHEVTVMSMSGLAIAYFKTEQPAEAEPICRDALRIGMKIFPPQHPLIGYLEGTYAVCLMRMEKYEEAEPLALSAYDRLEKSLGMSSYETEKANNMLAGVYRGWNKPEKMEPVLRRAVELRARVEKDPEDPTVLSAIEIHGALLLELGRPTDALAVLQSAVEIAIRTLKPEHEVRQKLETTLTAVRKVGGESTSAQASNGPAKTAE